MAESETRPVLGGAVQPAGKSKPSRFSTCVESRGCRQTGGLAGSSAGVLFGRIYCVAVKDTSEVK